MKPSQKLYRLEVAPLIILPLEKSPFFSYLSFSQIAAGSFVSIPFGRRLISGVVFDCAPLPGRAPSWMKFINHTIEEKFLTKEQLALAQYVSEEYFTSLGKTLKHFLPRRVKSRKKITKIAVPVLSKLRATKEDAVILKSFSALKNKTTAFLDASGIENPRRLLAWFAKKTIAQNKQVLFLAPEITLLPELATSLLEYFPSDKVAILTSQMADGLFFETWEKIRRGEASVILATRQGLFAPFKNLGLAVLLEEQDEGYKQWNMSPRYHSKRVAEKLALLHKAKLILTSGTPGLESYYRIKNKNSVPLIPLANWPLSEKNIEIVNLRLERFKKNYSPLSRALAEIIGETLKQKKQALLYVHRQGMDAFSVCENCKNILRCPKSGHALTGTKDGAFRCLSCGYKTGSFPNCPKCGHLSFRHIGFGAERVEKEIAKLFPAARVFRADGSTIRTLKDAEKLHEKISQNKIDILIGTQMILKGPKLPRMSLVGIIDADSLLAFPDFKADEKLFHIISRTAKRAKVVIQTFHPESAFFRRVSAIKTKEFAEQMLAEREELGYPPFSRLIAAAVAGKNEAVTDAKADELYKSLKPLMPKQGGAYRISSPQPAQKRPGRKMFESVLLLRIPAEKSLPENIKLFLQKNYKSLIVDVDPVSFF